MPTIKRNRSDQMILNRRKLKWIVVGLFSIVLFVFLRGQHPALFFDEPDARFEAAKCEFWDKTLADNNIIHLWPFDDPVPGYDLNTNRWIYPGTEMGVGRYGGARVFDGNDRTFIATGIPWRSFGGNFTLSLWVKADSQVKNQDIMWNQSTGFRLTAGDLYFDVPLRDGNILTLTSPYDGFDRFTHLAVTVDNGQGWVRLYLDGEEVAAAMLPSPTWLKRRNNVAFSRATWTKGRNPFVGSLDELVVWGHVMNADEIRQVAQSKRSIFRSSASTSGYLRLKLEEIRRDTLVLIGRIVHVQVPRILFPSTRGAGAADIPTINLYLSGNDRRHFAREHHRSRLSGRRTRGAARMRRVYLHSTDGNYEARLALLGSELDYGDNVRPSYHLILEEGKTPMGLQNVVLLPPESGEWIDIAVLNSLRGSSGLNAISNGFCRLQINGNDVGIYTFADYSALAVPPGELDAADGVPMIRRDDETPLFHRTTSPAARLSTSGRALPQSIHERQDHYDSIARRVTRLLANDPHSPFQSARVRSIIDERRESSINRWPYYPENWSNLQRAAETLDPFYVLGDNIAPERIVQPLFLEAAKKLSNGVVVNWDSLTPELLTHQGRPLRPRVGGPQTARLKATLALGTNRLEKILEFRVMPKNIALPTLSFAINQAVNKAYRVDSAIEFFPVGQDINPIKLHANQSSGGGIKHRGNTGYFANKRLLSIETDTPHGFFGDDIRRNAKSINALQDPSMACNSLAHQLFNSFPGSSYSNTAPDVIHAEAYVNGRYFGLLELSMRLDEYLFESDSIRTKKNRPKSSAAPRWVFFRSTVVNPRQPEMFVARPKQRRGDYGYLYDELVEWIEQPVTRGWIKQVPEKLEMVNFIDFQLLLSLFHNLNGAPFDYWFHEYLVYDAKKERFFHVPWDFDESFREGYDSLVENNGHRKLAASYPDYLPAMARRWRALRRNPLRTSVVMAKFNQIISGIADYSEWDIRRWQPDKPSLYRERVRRITEQLPRSLEEMDKFFDNVELAKPRRQVHPETAKLAIPLGSVTQSKHIRSQKNYQRE